MGLRGKNTILLHSRSSRMSFRRTYGHAFHALSCRAPMHLPDAGPYFDIPGAAVHGCGAATRIAEGDPSSHPVNSQPFPAIDE